MQEGLIPDVHYRVRVHTGDGYGIAAHRCVLSVRLAPDAAEDVRSVLCAGLIPWNRAVVRDGVVVPLIGLEIDPRSG